MTIIQIAHTEIKRFDSPECDPFDRHVIKLHARAAALVQEHSNVVLFANYRISTIKTDVGFNKKVTRALGAGEWVLHTARLSGEEQVQPSRYAPPVVGAAAMPQTPENI